MRHRFFVAAACACLVLTPSAFGQFRPREVALERFDSDGNGRLSLAERRAARSWLSDLQGGPAEVVKPTLNPKTSALYGIRPGPHPLRIERFATLHDNQQDKDLPLRITFPAKGGPYPAIVFSHGALSSKDRYKPLAQHWASHGYVVLQPTHGDSLDLMPPKEVAQIDTLQDRLNSTTTLQHWSTRPADVRLVLDSLKQLEETVDGFAGKVAHHAIGVGGHSFGAHTAMMVMGLTPKNLPPGDHHRLDDPRPRAALLISPQGVGRNLEPSSFRPIARPVLVVTGSEDLSPRTGETPTWRLTSFENLPPGAKTLLYLDGAHHGFGGISGIHWRGAGPKNEDQVNLIRSVTLAFWDQQLKGSSDARVFLESDQLENESGGRARLYTSLPPEFAATAP